MIRLITFDNVAEGEGAESTTAASFREGYRPAIAHAAPMTDGARRGGQKRRARSDKPGKTRGARLSGPIPFVLEERASPEATKT